MVITFNLRIEPQLIPSYSIKYSYTCEAVEHNIINAIAPQVRMRGYVTAEEFLQVCHWKTPRSKSHCLKNSHECIEEITKIALITNCEPLRIEILTLLKGVDWPTASVFLHFFHKDPYPILDFRALYSLGYDTVPLYNFTFWKAYTDYCRELAAELNIDMRTLDRALWQYSKENQNKSSVSV